MCTVKLNNATLYNIKLCMLAMMLTFCGNTFKENGFFHPQIFLQCSKYTV